MNLLEKLYTYLLIRKLRALHYTTKYITAVLRFYGQIDVKNAVDEIREM